MEKLETIDKIKADLPDVIDNTRRLIERDGTIGVITITFFDNGDAVESSDTRLVNLYQVVGSLEMVKARYLRGTNGQ